MTINHPIHRRSIVVGSLAAAGVGLLPEGLRGETPLPLTPACGRDGATPRQTEGPFFKPSSPERTSLLEPGLRGRVIEITGVVFTRNCRPIPKALLDFWQADAEGVYDNRGFRLRGHQFADGNGRFRLRTIVPSQYPGRTPHIHVKVQAPNGPVLTTQLYFPDQPRNHTDVLFRPQLLIKMGPGNEPASGWFDFVLEQT